jgi:hypothetical protein
MNSKHLQSVISAKRFSVNGSRFFIHADDFVDQPVSQGNRKDRLATEAIQRKLRNRVRARKTK